MNIDLNTIGKLIDELNVFAHVVYLVYILFSIAEIKRRVRNIEQKED